MLGKIRHGKLDTYYHHYITNWCLSSCFEVEVAHNLSCSNTGVGRSTKIHKPGETTSERHSTAP